MNERIREILKQATQYADSLGPIDGPEWCDAEYSKFAELIVQECVSVCDAMSDRYSKNRKAAFDYDEKNIYAEGLAASDRIKHTIKRKFGVKR